MSSPWPRGARVLVACALMALLGANAPRDVAAATATPPATAPTRDGADAPSTSTQTHQRPIPWVRIGLSGASCLLGAGERDPYASAGWWLLGGAFAFWAAWDSWLGERATITLAPTPRSVTLRVAF